MQIKRINLNNVHAKKKNLQYAKINFNFKFLYHKTNMY